MQLAGHLPVLADLDILFDTTQVCTVSTFATARHKALVNLSKLGIVAGPVLVAVPIFVKPIDLQSGRVANGTDPAGGKACLNSILTGVEVEEHPAVEGVPIVHVGTHRRYIPVPFLAR